MARVTEKEAQRIVAYYGKGNALRKAADKFNRSYETVRGLVTSAGLVRPRGRVAKA